MTLALPYNDLDLVLAQTLSFWRRYQGAKFLLTGGTGFVGNWLVQTVQRANDTLGAKIQLIVPSRDTARALRNQPGVFARSDIWLINGDIASFNLPPGPIDLCIHAATDVADPSRTAHALGMFVSIVDGTRHVLDVSRARGVSRLLLASSGAVYGTQPPELERVTETFCGAPDPLQPATAYGSAKRAAEWLTAANANDGANKGFEATIARIFALIGPGIPLNGPFAAGNFIRDALAASAVKVHGDGRAIRSYLYMADLCVWLLRLLESGESGTAYNVGSEHALSIGDLATMVARSNPSLRVEIENPSSTNLASPRYVPDTQKARQSFGLEELTPLPLAIEKTLHWTRATNSP